MGSYYLHQATKGTISAYKGTIFEICFITVLLSLFYMYNFYVAANAIDELD